MRHAPWLAVLPVALLFGLSTAHAIDTRAAGRCVALGALSNDYAAKAEAVLSAASATGHRALVEQRAREEFAYLSRHKNDKAARKGWTFQAVRSCNQF
jgi:hypothetical protein